MIMKKLQLPLGISDFEKIIEGNFFYIDKTLLIKELWETAGEVILMPRPRRFGKTLNLSMLQYFFEASETGKDHLFRNLNIWQHTSYRALQGTFPLIYLSLKDIKQETFNSAYAAIAGVISDEFTRHAKVLLTASLAEHERTRFMHIMERKASETELSESIRFLSMLLTRAHQRKALILIDEYDTPIHSASDNSYYEEMTNFMRSLICAAFKDNKHLERGFLTGILRTAKEGIFSGLNNLNVFSLLRNTLGDKFGFTSSEVDLLLAQAGLEEYQAATKDWYNSYRCGSVALYNPWSLLKCVDENGACKPYWVNTADHELMKNIIAYSSTTSKFEFELLFQGEQIEQEIKEAFVFPDIFGKSDALWSLLFFSGYVTYTEHRVNEKGKDICLLTIPNKEVHSVYGDLIDSIFKETLDEFKIKALREALLTNDLPVFQELLQEYIENSMSIFDTSEKEPERNYHLFILGLLNLLQPTYDVKSNRESGYGRYDILISPKDKSKAGIVIEFKKAQTKDLEKTADKALQQIEDKRYDQVLFAQGINEVIRYGIAIKGKQISIKSKCVKRND
jgi:Predicted AAA-ATPase/PD-(D/E)XK nuclease superfamily